MKRYSSRINDLYKDFYNVKLNTKTCQYDRIAGYFSSSILDIAQESFENIDGEIRILCNSDLSIEDIKVAQLADFDLSVNGGLTDYNIQLKMNREWNRNRYAIQSIINKNDRFKSMYDLLKSNKIKIRFIPKDDTFIHSKIGIIKYNDGSHTVFCGSVNETLNAWKNNYETLWEDESKEALDWAEEEFNYFWEKGVPISSYIIEDIKRLYDDVVITIDEWKQADVISPYPILKNTPLYTHYNGLLEHQIEFVQFALDEHLRGAPYLDGARLILADEVGLGKTFQLGAFAKLLSVYGDKPILIIAPKTLCFQWQEELFEKLGLHSAVWSDNKWVCEDESLWYSNIYNTNFKSEHYEFLNCPRKVGILSQGMITNSNKCDELLGQRYEAVLVDESHKATGGPFTSKPTKLTKFLQEISKLTNSMILATATPIQMNKAQILDALYILACGSDSVLGTINSKWRNTHKNNIEEAFKILKGDTIYFSNSLSTWQNYFEWLANPLLPPTEDDFIKSIREDYNLKPNDYALSQTNINDVIYNNKECTLSSFAEFHVDKNYLSLHNPITYHVIRRSRDTLESLKILPKIDVRLMDNKYGFGAIDVPDNIAKVANLAELFSSSIHGRHKKKGAGFTKTLLLRRLNSSLVACYNTVDKLLSNSLSKSTFIEDDVLYNDENISTKDVESVFKNMTDEEKSYLRDMKNILSIEKDRDPKYSKIKTILKTHNWVESGCIMFSQYYDTAYFVFENLIKDFPDEVIALYSGASKSAVYRNGRIEHNFNRDKIKKMVESREIRLFVGTDAASEGLNLQYLRNLINIDIPYNPTRLEQRKGRIQRPGQKSKFINIYNLRYKDSIDDNVHKALIERFKDIDLVFSKIPDVISDIWVETALKEEAKREKLLNEGLESIVKNKFDIKERTVDKSYKLLWESNCTSIKDKDICDMQKLSWESLLMK